MSTDASGLTRCHVEFDYGLLQEQRDMLLGLLSYPSVLSEDEAENVQGLVRMLSNMLDSRLK